MVNTMASLSSLTKLINEKQLFRTFKCARCATDVTSREAFRPSGSVEEREAYYSGEHKVHGYKIEVLVLLNGLAIDCTQHYPGSCPYQRICQENKDLHEKQLKKARKERTIDDIDELS